MLRKEIFYLLKSELRLKLIDVRTYPLNSISKFIGILIIILPIALGLRNTGNVAQLMTLIYLPLLTSVFMNTFGKVEDSTGKGVLEQCFNGSYTLLDIIIVSNMVSVIGNIIQTMIILTIIVKINPFLPMTLFEFIFVFFVILINGFSIGLLLSGFSLVYKRVGSLGNLISFFLFALMMMPIYLFPSIAKILFMTVIPSGGILAYVQNLAIPDKSLSSLFMIGLVLINSTAYFIISIKTFNSYYDKARLRGNLLNY